ncbi:MBG domain-containing protein [Hymenobacter koreensis]|uniref:Fibronectin type III domain-containing protein n=1 Tax=Hymenobacter koreensis TaxID=1084523 RepID=A0ABP8JMJ8_9BACT
MDAASVAAGNSIVASSGTVTYAAGYSGTSVITASAAGCNGPITATHTVTVLPLQTYFLDNDGDTFGKAAASVQACSAPSGYVSNSNDCDDDSRAVYPGALEVCGNGIDDNCNGQIDEGCAPIITAVSPASGAVGASVAVSGSLFTGATAVRFNGVSAVYTVNSDASITATVPAGASSGQISVVTPNGMGVSSTSFTVLVPPTIEFADISKMYGDAGFTVSATSNSAGTITYSLASGSSATVSASGQVLITGAGTVTIKALQVASGSYLAAERTATLSISPAPLTITANSRSKTYGDLVNFAGTEFTPTGLVNGNTVTSVTLSSTGAARTASVAGSQYEITPDAATGTGLENYTIRYVSGSLTVIPKELTITANNRSKVYNQALVLGTSAFTTTGLANSETVGSVTLTSTGAAATASVDGGPYTIVASGASGGTFTADNYDITYVSGQLTVDQAIAEIVLSNTERTYTGSALAATAATVPAGLSGVTLAYFQGTGASRTAEPAPTAAGDYAIEATLDNANYKLADGTTPVTGTLRIGKATPTVSWLPTPLAAIGYGTTLGGKLTASASFNGQVLPGAITYSHTGGSNVTEATVLAAKTGAYGLTAAFAPNDTRNFNSASTTNSIVVNRATQSITFANPGAKTFGDAAFDLGATASSGLTVSYSIVAGNAFASLNGNMLSISGAGSVTVRATQPGNDNFEAAEAQDRTFIIAPAGQSISFGPLTDKTYGAAPFMVSASAPGGPVTFSITEGNTFASISGSTITITGAGTVVVRASQAGSANYNPAANVDQRFTVDKFTPTITLTVGGPYLYNASAHFVQSATVSSVNDDVLVPAVSYSLAGNPETAPTNAGSYGVLATFAGNANYNPALAATGTLVIGRAPATIALTAADLTQTYTNSPKTVRASATPPAAGVQVAYSQHAAPVIPLNAGDYVVTATLTNANYQLVNASNQHIASVTGLLAIGKATPAVALNIASSYTYTGSNQEVSGSVTGVDNVSLGAASVTYKAAGAADFSATKPLNAGTYAVKGSYAETDNYLPAAITGSMTIDKATATLSFDASSLTATYNGLVHPASAATSPQANGANLSGVGLMYTGTDNNQAAYGPSTTAPINAGTYTVTASLNNPNYQAANIQGTMTIGRAAASISVVVGGPFVYTNTAKAVSSATVQGVTVNQTVQQLGNAVVVYRQGGANVTPIDAGTYEVHASFAGNGNYEPAANRSNTLSIGKATANVTVVGSSTIYDGLEHGATGNATGVNGISLNSSLNLGARFTDAPGGTASWVFSGGTNYFDQNGSVNIAIGKATPTVALHLNPTGYTYTGSSQAVTGSVTGINGADLGAAVVTYQPSGASGFSATAPLNAGTYAVKGAYPTSTNYLAAETNGSMTIGKALATISFGNLAHTYTGAVKAASAVTEPVGLGVVAIKYYQTVGGIKTEVQPINAGTYAVEATLTNNNYQLGASNNPTTGLLTIAKADQSIAWDTPANITYGTLLNGTQLNARASGVAGGSAAGGLTYSPASGAALGAGNHTLSVSAAATDNYNAASKTVQLTVNPAVLLVTADNKGKTYGDANPPLTVSYSGFVLGQSANVLTTAPTPATTATTASGHGSYDITVSGGAATNYSFTYAKGTLTVGKAALLVTANNQNRTYGAANPALTGTLVGVKNNDAIAASYTTLAGLTTGIGQYPIVAAVVASEEILSNYNLTPTNGTLTIGKAALAVRADNQQRMYGVDNPTLTGVLTGVLNGDDIVGAFSTLASKYTNVGTYPIVADVTATPAVLNNYTLTPTNGTLTIIPQTSNPVADTYYIGSSFFWTTGPNSSTATLNLVATLKNNANFDGDIRTARVSFFIRSGQTRIPINGAQNLPVGLVNPGDLSTGTAAVNVQYNISGLASILNIGVEVTGNYRNNPNDPSTDKEVMVAAPTPGGLIAGGGSFTNTGSAGYIKGSAGYAFYVQYNKSMKNPQGGAEITVKSYYDRNGVLTSVPHTYKLKSNAISVLAVTSPRAQFSSKANVKEIVNGVEVSIEGNCTMQMEMFDSFQNPSATLDSLAVTVYRSNGGIWYSSNWKAVKTAQRSVVAPDCITVTGSGSASRTPGETTAPLAASAAPAKAAPAQGATTNLLELYPNPMTERATIHFQTQKGGKVQVYLYNQLGVLVATLFNAEVQSGQEHYLTLERKDLQTGVYFCRLIINGQVINQRIAISAR